MIVYKHVECWQIHVHDVVKTEMNAVRLVGYKRDRTVLIIYM